jgi:hypothetical protein
MKARLVTGYIPIIDHPRPAEEYGELGEKLGGVPVRKKAFYQRVEDTWLAQYLRLLPSRPGWSTGDNPYKNSLAYHCVQHEKTAWLVQAAQEYDDDIFCWVDYGIFHQPGICNAAIVRFMESLDDKAIYAPGCWPKDDGAINPFSPCWRFCGSVLAVPRAFIEQLDQEVRAQAKATISILSNVEWEVNTWARVEQKTKLPFKWYKADHDVTQFSKSPTLRKKRDELS